DHYMWAQGWGTVNKDSTVETWVALSYLGAKTKKIKLGTMVTPIPFRPPAMLAKMVSTVDVLTDGRSILGVGAGWSQTEFEGYGHWDTPGNRVAKTREGLELILQLFQKPTVDFDGKFYHAKGAILEPKPVQKPHPPLLFGGVGPKMLEMAGTYGDIVHIPPWVNVPMEKSKMIVTQAAKKAGRENQVAFAAGGVQPDPKFDVAMSQKAVDHAKKNGAEFYLVAIPRMDDLKKFADAIIKSH
ncbi:MAG TPA: LLM class flavin-dependent oxidoreductase, partial [Candidatus Binatus sp.]|nr:LLM class flavin-dependent oxidoreductase [Candidatus Binatus sp.]